MDEAEIRKLIEELRQFYVEEPDKELEDLLARAADKLESLLEVLK